MATLVMKFGGSLTADSRRISRVAQVIMGEWLAWKRILVVDSAMACTTNALGKAADAAESHDAKAYQKIVARLRTDHISVINALFENQAQHRDLIGHMDHILFDVLNVCDSIVSRREISPRDRDLIAAAGERMMV